MKIGMTTTLTEPEQKIATWLGKQRFAVNQVPGVTDLKMSPRDGEDIDVLGAAGEIAFCKLANVCPDFSIGPRRGGSDCERLGESIDVKTRTMKNGCLLALRRKRETPCDCYALMIAEWPTFTFVGFMRGEELLQEWRLRDFGHGPGYAAEQSELTAEQIRW